MGRARALTLALLAGAALAAPAGARSGAAGATAERLAATRVLLDRLRASGRAEAAVRTIRPDPLGAGTRVVTGRLALEPPHFARLDLSSGEQLTLRADGGDWLQPAARQLVRAGARSAGVALAWWGVLLESGSGRFRERAAGPRSFVLTPADSDAAGPPRVTLGAGGLPERIEVEDAAGERVTWRLAAWRFRRPRGRAAFLLQAPPGYDVVELP
ncbi:MAG: hypothetical protein HZC42_01130 [Candidatus Eisenbacteria bacterium]|nr:hypothetical protein [Candidatus Eisenbacteria bacterium]